MSHHWVYSVSSLAQLLFNEWSKLINLVLQLIETMVRGVKTWKIVATLLWNSKHSIQDCQWSSKGNSNRMTAAGNDGRMGSRYKIRVVFIQFGSRRLKNARWCSALRSPKLSLELRQEYDYDDALHRVRPRSLELCNWMPYSVFFTFSKVCAKTNYITPYFAMSFCILKRKLVESESQVFAGFKSARITPWFH